MKVKLPPPPAMPPDARVNEHITITEVDILDALATAWREFSHLPQDHPDESREMRDAIHRAQAVIGMRIARRACPDVFTSGASVKAEWYMHPKAPPKSACKL